MDINLYSNPQEVLRKTHKYFGRNTELYLSTRKNKKYMIQNKDGKFIHFGLYPYQDFTKHKDKTRRDNFIKRNAKWANADKYTPAYMSYYLLW
jgi:hypothetical protein